MTDGTSVGEHHYHQLSYRYQSVEVKEFAIQSFFYSTNLQQHSPAHHTHVQYIDKVSCIGSVFVPVIRKFLLEKKSVTGNTGI